MRIIEDSGAEEIGEIIKENEEDIEGEEGRILRVENMGKD